MTRKIIVILYIVFFLCVKSVFADVNNTKKDFPYGYMYFNGRLMKFYDTAIETDRLRKGEEPCRKGESFNRVYFDIWVDDDGSTRLWNMYDRGIKKLLDKSGTPDSKWVLVKIECKPDFRHGKGPEYAYERYYSGEISPSNLKSKRDISHYGLKGFAVERGKFRREYYFNNRGCKFNTTFIRVTYLSLYPSVTHYFTPSCDSDLVFVIDYTGFRLKDWEFIEKQIISFYKSLARYKDIRGE